MAPRAVLLVLTFNCFLENSSEVIFIKVVQCIHSIVKIKDIAPHPMACLYIRLGVETYNSFVKHTYKSTDSVVRYR